MLKTTLFLLAGLTAGSALAGETIAGADSAAASTSAAPATATPTPGGPDSAQMESDLQHLSWKKFRAVIEAVPKMKANVEAYGPIGWQYVQANYTSYGWKKSIDKLDEIQKKHLAKLIQAAKISR